METESILLWGLLFSSIGLGYFMYGRRQEHIITKYCGITLMVFPYFAANLSWLIAIGVAVLAVPFVLRE